MNLKNIEQAEVKLFNSSEGFGFIKSRDGDVFFHKAFCGKIICNGADEPIFIRGGEEREFVAGTEVVVEKELAAKGWRAKGVAFLDTLNLALEVIDARPELRVVWKGAVVWQGKNQIQCKNYIESMNDSEYILEEQMEDGSWKEYN